MNRRLLFLVLACLLAGSGVAAQVPAPRVTVAQGVLEGISGGGVERFLGVPYAAPPLGLNRWQPPRAPEAWRGVRAAKAFGPRCVQGAEAVGSEDCLTLNVYRPVGARDAPVMVYVHGGFFTGGQSSLFDGAALASRFGVTVVTVNYRVGVMGFLAASGVGDGNYGLMDVIQALAWVRGNAGALGVNAGNVTLFGQSAGAAAICALMVSPEARGLFQKAVLQSGSCVSGTFMGSVKQARVAGDLYARSFQCGSEELGACLRRKSARELLAARFLGRSVVDPVPLYPVHGTAFLPLDPMEAFRQGKFARVPVLVGVNRAEGRVFEPFIPPWMRGRLTYLAGLATLNIGHARDTAQRYPLSAGEGPVQTLSRVLTDRVFACPAAWWWSTVSPFVPVFTYEFSDPDAPSRLERQEPNVVTGAFHGAELPYVLGTPVAGVADPAQFTPAQQKLSRQIEEYWTSFARSGVPASLGLNQWPAFTPAAPKVLTLMPGNSTLNADFAAQHQCDFWDGLDRRN